MSLTGSPAYPQGLKLASAFNLLRLKLPSDKQSVNISGMSSHNNETMVYFSDWNNSRVKSVCTSSGVVALLFEESDPHWRVSNALVLDKIAQHIAVAERGEGPFTKGKRIVIGRKNEGSFKSQQVVDIDEDQGVFRSPF